MELDFREDHFSFSIEDKEGRKSYKPEVKLRTKSEISAIKQTRRRRNLAVSAKIPRTYPNSTFFSASAEQLEDPSKDSGLADSQKGKDFSKKNQSSLLGMAANDRRKPPILRSPTVAEEDDAQSAHQDNVRIVVEEIMKQQEQKYCNYEDLTIFAGTYNVNGQAPTVGVTPWLHERLETAPDVYAVGFQELDLSVQTFANLRESPREAEWAKIVYGSLHPNAQYAEIGRYRLVGILLLVYIKRDLIKHMGKDSIAITSVATGLLNMAGNKGGVGIRLKVFDTTLSFVNSHLAAGNEELERRNQDFRQISNLVFHTKTDGPLRLEDHDVSFWLGDLNYRLQYPEGGSPDIMEVKKKIDQNNFGLLTALDQLIQMQGSRKAFFEYNEGELMFRPTYKYDPKTDDWDSSEKQRAPAWCDRVLWLKTSNTQIKLKEYTSVMDVKISDHKPVRAVFQLKAKRIDVKKQRKVYEDALKEGDRLANEALPVVELDNIEFDFGTVEFLEPKVLTLKIKNMGKFPVQFRFRRKLGTEIVCKLHIIITPVSHKIPVGKDCLVDIQLLVDKNCAWDFENGRETVDDILVLHLSGGRDHFLMVNGTYGSSCFGKTIEDLVKHRKPSEDFLIDLGGDGGSSYADIRPEKWKDVPLELYRLVDHLETKGLLEEDLFSQTGSHTDFSAIRKCLDSGSPSEIPGSIHSVSEALLRLLDSLQDSVIPTSFNDRILRLAATPAGCWDAVNDLKGHLRSHGKTLEYLIGFLKKVVAHSQANKTNLDILCTIFSSLLFRMNEDSRASTGSSGLSSRTASVKALEEHERNRQRACITFIKNLIISDKQTVMEDQFAERAMLSGITLEERSVKCSSLGSKPPSSKQGNSSFYH